jgi:hypothetical protein
MKREKPKHAVVLDDELHPLTRTYRLGSEQPPPLPGRDFSVVSRVEATFIVRDEELHPLTHAEWVQAPQRAARGRAPRARRTGAAQS